MIPPDSISAQVPNAAAAAGTTSAIAPDRSIALALSLGIQTNHPRRKRLAGDALPRDYARKLNARSCRKDPAARAQRESQRGHSAGMKQRPGSFEDLRGSRTAVRRHARYA